jgi:hypothetical protein
VGSRNHNREAVPPFSPTLPPCGYVGSELTARTQPRRGCVVVHDRSQGSRAIARQPWALRLNRFAVKEPLIVIRIKLGTTAGSVFAQTVDLKWKRGRPRSQYYFVSSCRNAFWGKAAGSVAGFDRFFVRNQLISLAVMTITRARSPKVAVPTTTFSPSRRFSAVST